MSRIHEALKKAEQERAMSQPGSRVEATPAALEVAEAATTAVPALGTALGLGIKVESGLAQCRQTRWAPDTNCMLFFSSEEHAPGMEEFRTLRSRLYQLREKQPISKLLVTSALPKEGKSFTSANLAQVWRASTGAAYCLLTATCAIRNFTISSARNQGRVSLNICARRQTSSRSFRAVRWMVFSSSQPDSPARILQSGWRMVACEVC